MTTALAQTQELRVAAEAKKKRRIPPPQLDEFVALCPKCKTLETLWFVRDRLLPTRKFYQNDGHVYHACGSSQPCRLYRGSWEVSKSLRAR